MDIKESLIIVMSTESKIFTGVLASAITGFLVALHVVDPTQVNTVSGDIQTVFGLLISLVAVGYGLETLLVKHKAEVADGYYEQSHPEEPTQPQTKQEVAASTPAVQATETPPATTP